MSLTILTLVLTLVLAVPLGLWCKKVLNHDVPFVNRTEEFVMKKLHISSREMNWKQYLLAAGLLAAVSFAVLLVILLAQGMEFWVAFNTACSFVTNTNWQSYDPVLSLDWQAQAFGLTVQNFVSAAMGICVLFALIRGLIQKQKNGLGNFWQDMLGTLLFILLPLNLLVSVILAQQGVPMNLNSEQYSALSEPVAADSQGLILEDALIENGQVLVDGKPVQDAVIITEQRIPGGMAASQIAIKQSGTNGGGITAANSASPFENPTPLTNVLENVLILLIPMALCFSFGFMTKNRKQGYAVFAAMFILFVLAAAAVMIPELQAMDMEGKEARIGVASSALWSASTTAASSGSVNSALNSMNPVSSMICLVLMQVGEVIFGGAGSGLYGMLAFVILTVFIAGLMVGRTPEFMHKKIEPREMKWAVILCLATPVCILAGSAISALCPMEGLDPGAHGFTQLLYAWSSMGANNGSAMGGYSTAGWLLNGLGGLLMLAARFVPMAGALAIAGSLSAKKPLADNSGELKTDNGMFVFLLILVVLLIGALSFFPALALGPVAEFLG
ncbi:potassium-transporting ATPase subunit KdpA [uncultured Faecalibaculum sp.]|uniref:potassium-transporting ATPase subunit KdpA n=1 Tax=uncultured Faecalibaculum sp. TaxID=1729681 RepID=UPI00273174FF|nr:potassium-transporting ATPase subunit KdpA [uncultured Faecalibaculum sp.]